MARPTREMLRITSPDPEIPSRWFWQPDVKWLNEVNTTNLRTLNAIRAFVALTAVFLVVFALAVFYALTRCGVVLNLFGYKVLSILPPPGKLSIRDWMVCEEAMARGRMLDFAINLFDSYALLLAAMAAVALGAMVGKRLTDTEHRERVERAKKAPVVMAPMTGEHQAQQAGQQVNVTVEAKPPTERPATPAEEPQWATGDPRGGVL
jgi:hypothetical protein